MPIRPKQHNIFFPLTVIIIWLPCLLSYIRNPTSEILILTRDVKERTSVDMKCVMSKKTSLSSQFILNFEFYMNIKKSVIDKVNYRSINWLMVWCSFFYILCIFQSKEKSLRLNLGYTSVCVCEKWQQATKEAKVDFYTYHINYNWFCWFLLIKLSLWDYHLI